LTGRNIKYFLKHADKKYKEFDMLEENVNNDENPEITKKWLKLMGKWKKERPDYKIFCDDGILKYWANTSKIMFLLKETYKGFNEIRGSTHYGKGTNSSTFWRRMRMWTYIIDEMIKGNIPSFNDTYNMKEEVNDSIAHINLKKNAERKANKNMAYSNDFDIREYVQRDKDFLLKQIDIINPHIIICCSTFEFCHFLYANIDKNKIANKLYKVKNIYFIDFGHPSQRSSYENNYKELVKIVKKITADINNVC
jgi:hypothetical protein